MFDEYQMDELPHNGPAKRQRPLIESNRCDNEQSDCYHEVLEGSYNGPLRHSWFNTTHAIGAGRPCDTGRLPDENDDSGLSPIESLRRQLLQVKRRLWPAAEQCAQATGMSSAQSEFSSARRICNPMEPLGEGRAGGLNNLFMNRSAIKLANMDAILDFSLTTKTNTAAGPFLFVDLCGAPGGFSEYIMKRYQSEHTSGECRGYGMSLKGSNEHGRGIQWKLAPEVSETNGGVQTKYLICHGMDGTGDIYKWENVISMQHAIETDLCYSGISQQKVNLVLADGGMDVQRDSECQEELAQKLVVCQVAAGLFLLQQEGTLIVKMFGFQTLVLKSLMRNLFEGFDQITVLKPISSRPASSERYVVCSGFKGLPMGWDGLKWMNSVFMGDWYYRDQPLDENLALFMERCDRDLFTLNLKACFSILSCMERKAAAMKADSWDKSDWCPERPAVNVGLYKRAWRLG